MTDSPFRFIESVLKTKQYQLNTEADAKEYSAFFTNRAVSQHIDSIFHANAMNINGHIPAKWSYDYLFNVIRKMKRPHRKWGKRIKDENVEMVMAYQNYSYAKARAALPSLSDSDLKAMKALMEVGG